MRSRRQDRRRPVPVIAGPCSVEGENLIRIARRVKAAGATMLRGGAYKPRTSPTPTRAWAPPASTCCARRLPSSTCRSSPRSWTRATCRSSDKKIDVMQIGARNAQNFPCSRRSARPRPRFCSSAACPARSTSCLWQPSTS
ncbi:MAG: hypothetical protein ACLU37_03115 [Collinsella sp.]